MRHLGTASVLLLGACAPPPSDVVAALPVALETAQEAAARAETPRALRDALALAYTDDALTAQLRDRWRGREARGGTLLQLTEFVVEDLRVLEGSTQDARLEASWRMAGTVVHSGHAHPRHLRAWVRWEARQTPGGWRISREQPLEVLALP